MYHIDDNFTGKDGLAKYQAHRKLLQEDPLYKEEWDNQQKEKLKIYWNNLNPFKEANDVPNLPKPLEKYYIDKLIELGAIPKKELENDQWYYGDYRNNDLAKWNNKTQEFDHIRYKFGFYWDTCNHFEDDNGYALFVPLRKATNEEIENELKKFK